MPDTEIYIEYGDEADVLRWLGTPTCQSEISDGILLLYYPDHFKSVVVKRVDKRPWLSIYFPSSDWRTDRDCAIDAGKLINKAIYCCSEDNVPEPSKWICIRGQEESIEYIQDED